MDLKLCILVGLASLSNKLFQKPKTQGKIKLVPLSPKMIDTISLKILAIGYHLVPSLLLLLVRKRAQCYDKPGHYGNMPQI